MPWIDTAIIILVLAGAYIGYCKGFIGCLKGIIGCAAGLVAAWITKPLAMAWLQARWGVETKLALFLSQSMPENVEELIKGVGEAANTLQELKDSLLSLPLPAEVVKYLNQALQSGGQEVFNAESVMESLMLSVAQAIIGAVVFLLIWWSVSFIVRWILGLFTGGDGFSLFGVVDGLLGMTAFTAMGIGGITLLSGALYPAALLATMGGGQQAGYYTLILNSGIMRFLANVYQINVLPLLS